MYKNKNMSTLRHEVHTFEELYGNQRNRYMYLPTLIGIHVARKKTNYLTLASANSYLV